MVKKDDEIREMTYLPKAERAPLIAKALRQIDLDGFGQFDDFVPLARRFARENRISFKKAAAAITAAGELLRKLTAGERRQLLRRRRQR